MDIKPQKEEKRSESVRVYITPTEKTELELYSKEHHNISFSDIFRSLWIAYIIKTRK